MRRGHRMVLPKGSMQTWAPAFTGEYDEADIDEILAVAVPGSVVLDIGACFGLYTVPLALEGTRRAFDVVAFEPVPSNLRYLQLNLSLSGAVARIEPTALGEAEGEIDVLVERAGAGNAAVAHPGITAQQYRDLGGGTDRVGVPVKRLDSISGLDPCSVVKIDVEGYELDVLRGAEEFLRRNRPTIFGEFSPSWFAARGVSTGQLLKWADRSGYDVLELRPRRMGFMSDRLERGCVRLGRSSDRTDVPLRLTPR
jgi:FkbM family methyltransferase